MVPLRGNQFKAAMVLRSILVVDRTYTQVKRPAPLPLSYLSIFPCYQKATAMRFAQQRSTKAGNQPETLKRRVGYFEEELMTTRAKLSNMQVDEVGDFDSRADTSIRGTGSNV